MVGNYTIHDLTMKRPASVLYNRWRDGSIIGSGKTGILLYGGVSAEYFVVNRGDMWQSGKDGNVPDVSYCLEEMRCMQKNGDYKNAQNLMYDELNKKGYSTSLADMRALGQVKLLLPTNGIYSDYSRVLHMDTAEVEISYKIDGKAYTRRNFMSRKRDIGVIDIVSEQKQNFTLNSGFYITKEGKREETTAVSDVENAVYNTFEDCYVYSSWHEGKYFGIICKIISDGCVKCTKEGIRVLEATKSLLLIKAFSEETDRNSAIENNTKVLLDCPLEYEVLFEENLPLYQKYYFSADISLFDENQFNTNEHLLEDARENKISTELAEKLWRFGRYFFISSTAIDGLPCPLYGLWPCGYEREFTHNVANENVQCIYWHTDVGGLDELVVPLINYYYDKMDSFRENARKLYGCRGIFIGTYTTPKNGAVAWFVPVILHFIGVAGWLSHHFYKYYKFTSNEQLFKEKILPFMLEAAEFYEDFYYTDDNGKLVLYPAVSPENSPAEYFVENAPHPMTVVKNPTVEIAILKELLLNLLEVSKNNPQLYDKAEKWQQMLNIIPEYLINGDGAVAEWMDENVSDYYAHRHFSHLYPIFPGTELEDSKDLTLMPAFKRAVDLRGFGSFCGWSMPHMSAIYSRLGQANKAYDTLNCLSKVCLLDNFFTLGYDFRDMGITGYDCGDEFRAPVQFDALIGSVNAIQEMLIFSSDQVLRLLPACPREFAKGKAKLYFNAGIVDFEWNLEKEECKGIIIPSKDSEFTLQLPFGREKQIVSIKNGEEFSF